MQCKEIQKKLSAYQDGEVKPDEEIIIRDHLKACSACQEQWQALHVMWKFVNTLPLSEPEPYFFTRLQARIAHSQQNILIKRIKPLLMPVCLLIGVSIGILSGQYIWRNGNGMTEISQKKNWTDGLYLESLTDYPEASLSAFYFQNAQFIQNDMGGAQ